MNPRSEEKPKWHIEKGVPLALVYMMAAQLAGGVWFAAAVFKEVESNTRRITTVEQQRVSERLATLEAQMTHNASLLVSLNTSISRVIENQVARMEKENRR